MLFTISAIFLYETGPIQWMFNQHCGYLFPGVWGLTHWGRVTHICVGKLTIIGSDNGLSPGRRQAIIWTNAGILLIGPSGTNFSEILSEIQLFSFKKMHLKMSSVKWRPFCFGLNVLIHAADTPTAWMWCQSTGDPLDVFQKFKVSIRSSDNDSTGFWPPGSLHTLGADGHI